MNRSATKHTQRATFSSSAYLAQLMAELDRAAISLRLGRSRDEAGLTQPEMAEILGLHWRTIQNYETPRDGRVPWDRLDEWAKITGRTKEWLLYGDATPGLEASRLEAIEAELRAVRAELALVRETLPDVERVLALARDLQAQLQARADIG